jgi:hypothetical protein
VQRVVTSVIKRARNEQLAQLELRADQSVEYAHGRGKNGKGRNDMAIQIHNEWANRFRKIRQVDQK